MKKTLLCMVALVSNPFLSQYCIASQDSAPSRQDMATCAQRIQSIQAILSQEVSPSEQNDILIKLDIFVNFMFKDMTNIGHSLSSLPGVTVDTMAATLGVPSPTGRSTGNQAEAAKAALFGSFVAGWEKDVVKPTAAILKFFNIASKYKDQDKLRSIPDESSTFETLGLLIKNIDSYYEKPIFVNCRENPAQNPSGLWKDNKLQLVRLMLTKGYWQFLDSKTKASLGI
jgi:hypothetical protein